MGGYYGDPGGTKATYEPSGGTSAEGDTRGARWTPYQASISTKLRQPGYSMAAFGDTPTVNSPGVGGQVYAKQANATARKVDSAALALHNHLMGSQGSAGPMAEPRNPYEHATIASYNARHPAPSATPGSRIGVQAPMMASRPGVQAPAARMATAGDSDMAGISQQAQPFKPTPIGSPGQYAPQPFKPTPIGSPGQYAPQPTTAASGSTIAPFAGRQQSPAQLSSILASQYGGMSGQRAPARPGVQGTMMAGRPGVQGGPQHSGVPNPLGGFYSVASHEAGLHGLPTGRYHEFAQERDQQEKLVAQQSAAELRAVEDHTLGVAQKKAVTAGQLAQNAQLAGQNPDNEMLAALIPHLGAAGAVAFVKAQQAAKIGAKTTPEDPATPEDLKLSHPEVAGMLAMDPDGSPKSDPLTVLNMAKNSGIDFSNQANPNVMALQRHFKTAYGDKVADMTKTPEPSLRTLPGLPEWIRQAANIHTLGALGTSPLLDQPKDMKDKQSLADQLSALMGQSAPAQYKPTYNTDLRPWSGFSGLYNKAVYGKP